MDDVQVTSFFTCCGYRKVDTVLKEGDASRLNYDFNIITIETGVSDQGGVQVPGRTHEAEEASEPRWCDWFYQVPDLGEQDRNRILFP